jgi:hypothetical protein
MEPAPDRLLHVTDRYALAHDLGSTWAGAEGFRLEGQDVKAAVDEVHARVGGRAERCSWWLTERSAPADLEDRLLALGLVHEEDDYLHAGMLLTREPPRVDGIEVRRVSTLGDRRVGTRTRRVSRRRPRALGCRRRAGHARPRGRRRLDVEADPRTARLRAGAAVSAARAPSYGLMFWLTWNRLSGSYLRFTCVSRS